ncbi:hypothetical protein WJX73_007390 [Symbiochloris irregularis]|uniref:Derlin n=1 Tax=Symbiochloris irregularis TaxID=706552 RepID=A0AAW1PE93_9CHLO
MQMPVVRLVWAGKPAVRVLMILSGIVLSNRTLSCIQTGNSTKALKALVRGIQMRYVRLAIPLTMISCISVLLLWMGAYETSRQVPGYLTHGPPKSQGNVFYDLWLAVWGGFVDLYVLGYQPAHSSLWCMKAQLLGSYMLYGILLIYGGRASYPWLMWIVGAAILISGNAAAARLTDAASVLFGAIVAYHMRFMNRGTETEKPMAGIVNGVSGGHLWKFPTRKPWPLSGTPQVHA